MASKHIYIHFPYCLYKCHYCDFNSYPVQSNQIPGKSYTDALLKEIDLRQTFFDAQAKIDSIYFGGGTPSLMHPEDVEKILCKLQRYFLFSDNAEITLECNPGTVNGEKLHRLKQAGINRLSIGIQSLHDKFLKKFGRIHTAREAIQVIDLALESHIPRVSVDLIFGFPNQTLEEWQSDLEKIISCHLGHISCYALTPESGTLYHRQLQEGIFHETSSDHSSQMQAVTRQLLKDSGWNAYEISNYALLGQESRHNLGYWHYDDYLGLGAGAFSNLCLGVNTREEKKFVLRTENINLPEDYMQGIQDNNYSHEEWIDRCTAMSEFMMMGLRLKEGVSKKRFEDFFMQKVDSVFNSAIASTTRQGLMESDSHFVRPTEKGVHFNNCLAREFLLP